MLESSECGKLDGKLWKVFLLRGSFFHILLLSSLVFLCWHWFCCFAWILFIFSQPGVRGKGLFEKFTFPLTWSGIFVAGSEMDLCNNCFPGYFVGDGVRRWKHWYCLHGVCLQFWTGADTAGANLVFRIKCVLYIWCEYCLLAISGAWWSKYDWLVLLVTLIVSAIWCQTNCFCCSDILRSVLSLGKLVCRWFVWLVGIVMLLSVTREVAKTSH